MPDFQLDDQGVMWHTNPHRHTQTHTCRCVHVLVCITICVSDCLRAELISSIVMSTRVRKKSRGDGGGRGRQRGCWKRESASGYHGISLHRKKKKRKKSERTWDVKVCKCVLLIHVSVRLPAWAHVSVISDSGCHVLSKYFLWSNISSFSPFPHKHVKCRTPS